MTHDMSSVTKLVSELAERHCDALSEAQIFQLQRLDHIVQSLQDLSVVSQILAEEDQSTPHQETRLKLAETRAILSPDSEAAVTQEAGSVELF
ncbi:hypothetical protein [Tateyamaria omphalii]|nr:hypothetical protein [Tateyamaria omphalii]